MGPYGSQISKRLLYPSPTVSVRFQPNFLIRVLVIGEYRLLLFWQSAKIKILWHFKILLTQDHMGVEISNEILTLESMGNLKCGMSQKRLIVERNGRKFGTRDPTVHICRPLLMPDDWFGVIRCTLQISDSTNFETLLLKQSSTDFNKTSHKVS